MNSSDPRVLTEIRSTRTVRVAAYSVVAGPLLCVFGGRWAAYVGIAPIFLTDVLVLTGAAVVLCDALSRSHSGMVWHAPYWALALLVAVGTARSPSLGILAARDAAPFVYFLLTPIFVYSVGILGAAVVWRAVAWASIGHLVWFAAVVYGLMSPVPTPLGEIPFFDVRGDFDAMLVGLALPAYLVSGGRSPRVLLLIVFLMPAALMQGSRAGLLGAVAILCLGLWPQRRRLSLAGRKWATTLALFGCSTGILAVLVGLRLPTGLSTVTKLLNTRGQLDDNAAASTTSARIEAWTSVISYMSQNDVVRWLGLGFGNSGVFDSGAVVFLSNDQSVRAAHSFWIQTYMNAGLLGLVLCAMWFCWLAAKIASFVSSDGCLRETTSVGLLVALCLTASLGVILESPFGYQTFVLALALALSPISLRPTCAIASNRP